MKRTDRFIRDCKSWDDFFQRNKQVPIKKEQGDNFERLVQLFLQTDPEYANNNLVDVWIHDEVPADVHRTINLPSRDEGGDLIVRDVRGRPWMVQAKFRSDPSEALTLPDINSARALAFNTCRNIHRLVIAHTCLKPPRKRSLMKKTIELGLERWREMDWSLIRRAIKGKSVRPKRRKPYPYQAPAIVEAEKHFLLKKERRGRLIMPCGTGKSLIGFWIAGNLKAKNVVIAVPSLGLLKQTVADWAREFYATGQSPYLICVCSDETAGNLKKDEAVGETYQIGLPTYTNTKEIARELLTNGPKVVFTTYQSSDRLVAAARRAKVKFDLVIYDEAHRTTGPRYKKFATLLRENALDARYRLFMTATERKINGDAEVFSMDDNEEDYGKRFFTMTYKEAIRLGAIVDYKILTMTVSEARIKKIIAENNFLKLRSDNEAEARQVAIGIALRDAIRKYNIKQALSFHSSIRGAADFCELQKNDLNRLRLQLASFHINSGMSAGQRAAYLKDFRETISKPALMTNARCLQEGIDVPSIDCVIFVDPKQSYVDIVQAAGRAMRTAKGKKLGYLLLPLIIPEKMTFKDFAETTAFNEIARIISALSVADERIVEELRVVGNGGVPKKNKRRRIILVEDGTDDILRKALKISLSKFANAITVRAWEKVARVNFLPFEEAREVVRGLGFKSFREWLEYTKSDERRKDIPADPATAYEGKGWIGKADWIGKSKPDYRPFNEALAFVRALGFKSEAEWRRYSKTKKKPKDIPASPAKVYPSEWRGMSHWLGNSRRPPNNKVLPFKKARAIVHKQNIKTREDWESYKKSKDFPNNIPRDPRRRYAHDWVSWGDWFGDQYRTLGGMLSYEQARAIMRKEGLKSQTEFRDWCASGKRPFNIPSNPNTHYADSGWINWPDWLGYKLRAMLPLEKARTIVRRKHFKNIKEYKKWCASGKRPSNIPAKPHQSFKDSGWAGYPDFLGCGGRVWLPFKKARAIARSLKLKGGKAAWMKLSLSGKRPPDIPANPPQVYKKSEWVSWPNWLAA
jgi:superfamily II DNA or RNA helicase